MLIGVTLVAACACVLVAVPAPLRSAYVSPAGLGALMTIGHHLTLWKVATSASASASASASSWSAWPL
jgi:hypothetical protein